MLVTTSIEIANQLNSIALRLAQHTGGQLPSVLLARHSFQYEVEFVELEIEEETKLMSSAWVCLALADAARSVSVADIDSCLGFGEIVSTALVRNLLEDGLLEVVPPVQSILLPSPKRGRGIFSLFGGGRDPEPTPASVEVSVVGNKLYNSSAPSFPKYRLNVAGANALKYKALVYRRPRGARLRFLVEPLLFLGVTDEQTQRYVQHSRPRLLDAAKAPPIFRELDSIMAMPGDDRFVECGIGHHVSGISGRIVGVVPGSQWEVRPVERKKAHQTGMIILAAYPETSGHGLSWRLYTDVDNDIRLRDHVDTTRLLPENLRGPTALREAVSSTASSAELGSLGHEGAFEFRYGISQLPQILGKGEAPNDTYLPISVEGWNAGVRVHPTPADAETAILSLREFLTRHDAGLRKDFDNTYGTVATSLKSYWGTDMTLPSAEEMAASLWPKMDLRAALCMRRLQRDLVVPYRVEQVLT